MKTFISLFLFLSITIMAQDSKVIINVITDIPDTEKVYITGDIKLLGNWEPSAIPLEEVEPGIWSRTFMFVKGRQIQFKFTLGDWEHEALDENGKTPSNTSVKIGSDTTLNFTVKSWGTFREHFESHITGKAEYIKNFELNGLKPRDIIIWLPPGYDESTRRYPVLYAHDGQNIIDPATSAFGIDWQMDEAADSLIKKNEIEPIIIVGIYSTPDRFIEYSDTDTGHAYINSIINELKPLIDSRYRTLTDKENTAVTGSSMGGLISFIMLWEYPDVFSRGACLSPAFAHRNFDYTVKVKESTGARKISRVYIDNGGVGLELELQPGIDKMIEILKKLGYEEGKDFTFILDEKAEHNEAAWAKRFPFILKYLFGAK